MRSQLKTERGFFLPHQDLNQGPLEPKASVLPMSYTDFLMIKVSKKWTKWLNIQTVFQQISAKRGPNSRFVIEANTKSLWPKLSWSQKVKLMDRGRVTQPQVEYWVISRAFFSTKVEFLLESGNKSLYKMHQSRVIIWLWPINGQNHK